MSHFITINNFQDSKIPEKSILHTKYCILGGQNSVTPLNYIFFSLNVYVQDISIKT